ncbi:MAG TPA: gamma-glutamyltransferase [Thermoanaerobaculia bacterium]
MKRAPLFLALLLAARIAAAFPVADERAIVARGRGGAVAAEEGTAAKVGVEILEKGGNATDAAVAVALALAVTWPEAGNIGGGGFWLSRDTNGRSTAIDFRERAPRAARRDMYSKPAGPATPPPSSTDGPLASGVPGTVDGLALAHRRTGHLPWRAVVEPAVRLAREGFPMTENVRSSIAADRKKLAADRESAAIFLPGGEPPPAGAIFRQPALARTLEAIRDRGEDGFYRGRVAREIEEGQKKAGGSITRGDLALYNAKVRKPVTFRFLDAEVLTTGAPSSGPALAAMAALVVSLGPKRFRAEDAAGAHLLAEIEKRVYRDRNRYLGDPDFPGVRQDLFLSPERIRRIAATIDPDRATPSDALKTLEPRDGSTTHFSVADARGNLVAVTTTLNDSFGNGRVAPGLGFLWNNEMDDFATRPGEPNLYGLVQGEVNAVAPGKRMLSAMCPTIAVIPKRGAFAWGSPGGSTILSANFQVLLGLVLRGESLEAAVGAPRFHQQDFPDVIEIERDRFDPAWVTALETMGHTVKVSDREPVPGRFGRVHAVGVLANGTMEAVADPRRHGAALVVVPAP